MTQTRADDHHQAGHDPGREVHRERPEDRLPDAPGQHPEHDDDDPRHGVREPVGNPDEAGERHQAQHDQRDAEHQRRGGIARGEGEEQAERDAEPAEHDSPAPAHDRRLRDVADRRGDRHHADTPRREGHHDQREQHAEREGDQEALPREGELHLQAGVRVLCAERLRHQEHHAVGDHRAEDRPDGGGDQVVGRPLEHEHLDEVPSPRADRAGDPELAAALGGEHHEDEEDQQDPGGDRERAERREERHERAAGLVRRLDRVLLDRRDVELRLVEHRLELGLDPVGEVRAEASPEPRFEIITPRICFGLS